MDHHFEVEDARTHGVEKAVILYNLKYWIRHNKANSVHEHDGHTWTYNSARAFAVLFPYFDAQKIGRMLLQLEEAGVILSGNYNLAGYDQTKWYAFVDEEAVFQGQLSNLTNGYIKSDEPIPDVNSGLKLDTNKEGGPSYVEPTSEPSDTHTVAIEGQADQVESTDTGGTIEPDPPPSVSKPSEDKKPGLYEYITTVWRGYNPAASLSDPDKKKLAYVIQTVSIKNIETALCTVWEDDASKPPRWALSDFNWSTLPRRQVTHEIISNEERDRLLVEGREQDRKAREADQADPDVQAGIKTMTDGLPWRQTA